MHKLITDDYEQTSHLIGNEFLDEMIGKIEGFNVQEHQDNMNNAIQNSFMQK